MWPEVITFLFRGTSLLGVVLKRGTEVLEISAAQGPYVFIALVVAGD